MRSPCIANKAIGRLPGGDLKTLIQNNLTNITLDIAQVTKKGTTGLSKADFVPLADVPDLAWKIGPNNRGEPEHPNHFADMDRKLDPPLPEGETLLAICDDPANIDVEVWTRYYDAVDQQHPDQERDNRGLLPFRVWQIFDAMVYFVQQRQVENFVCAAGILSHYVGDACQPLHISYLFNGDPDRASKGMVRNRRLPPSMVEGMISYGAGCHGAYEDNMIDFHVGELWPGVDQELRQMPSGAIPTDGKSAAGSVIRLMKDTFAKIAPMDIVEAYKAEDGQQPKAIAQALWDTFGDRTIKVIADGSDCLARLWHRAWQAGNGSGSITELSDQARHARGDLRSEDVPAVGDAGNDRVDSRDRQWRCGRLRAAWSHARVQWRTQGPVTRQRARIAVALPQGGCYRTEVIASPTILPELLMKV